MVKIDEALAKVTACIHQATLSAHRKLDSVRLIAVTKTQPPEIVRQAYQLGQRLFGENYLQEALDKQSALEDLNDIEWHFIGPIQSNKTKPIAEHFAWVQSIDRLKIAERLSTQRPKNLAPLQVCIQVNIDDEVSKSGVSLTELPEIAAAIARLPQLKLRGLMCIPAPTHDTQQQARAFASLRHEMEALNQQGFVLDTLSMGMSSDLEVAIAEGATLVRVGTDIFGARSAVTPNIVNHFSTINVKE